MQIGKLSKRFKIIVIAVALVVILTTSYARSVSFTNVTISMTGAIIIGSDMTALSGSTHDIQVAVDAVAAAGGGTVYIPAGNFTLNIDFSVKRVNNQYAGVEIPGGVNVIGAGNNQTILYCPFPTGWNYSLLEAQTMFLLNGVNNKPIRISGIYFEGSNNFTIGADDNRCLSAIIEYGVRNFRVDHNTFIDFNNFAADFSNNYVQNPAGNCGVFDYNIVDNPYKEVFYNLTGNFPIWGYGVGTAGNSPSAMAWRPLNEVLGSYEHDVVYIEDSSFRRCRHEIAAEGAGSGGWYVSRFNNFTEMIVSYLGSYNDIHGGGRGAEVYNNTFNNCLTTYASAGNQPSYFNEYMGAGVNPRGGSGVIFNNTFNNFDNEAILLSNDQSLNATWRCTDWWIWGNIFNNVSTQVAINNGIAPYTIISDLDYYLRAPTQVQDGFTYNPPPYPFPFDVYGVPN